jgi:hypothetical protein
LGADIFLPLQRIINKTDSPHAMPVNNNIKISLQPVATNNDS